MSFDVFVQAFRNGDATPADADAVRQILTQYVTETDSAGFARLSTADGGADLYGYDELGSGFMANHVSGSDAWEVLVRAAVAGGLVIIPVGCPVGITDRSSFEHLPDGLRAGEVSIVSSGTQLIDLIEGRLWACPVCFEPVLSGRPYENWPPADLTTLSVP